MTTLTVPVQYHFYDITSGTYWGTLPLVSVTFTQALNQSGAFSATLPINDPHVQKLAWRDATRPGRTFIYIDINGSLVYGGIIWSRRYRQSDGSIQLGGNDFWSYFQSRAQAKTYSYQWVYPVTQTSMVIAKTVMTDALQTLGSGLTTLEIVLQGKALTQDWVSMSYPVTEIQSVQMITSMLQQMGYGVGFDFASSAYWVGTGATRKPKSRITLANPMLGRPQSQTGLVINTAHANDYEYPEDATQTGNRLYETSTSDGSILVIKEWQPAIQAGYPILDQLVQHPDINSTPVVQIVLEQVAESDLAIYTYPKVTPKITLPMFGKGPVGSSISVGTFEMGDGVRFIVPHVSGDIPIDPRFPTGVDFEFRIISASYTVADQGESTMKLTLNVPPSTAGPVPAPI